jgi:hypothetical protein
MDKLIGDAHRSRVKQEHPTLDDAAVNQIVEETQRVYPLIREACRKQVEQQHPDVDEAAVDAGMAQTPMPPMWGTYRLPEFRAAIPVLEWEADLPEQRGQSDDPACPEPLREMQKAESAHDEGKMGHESKRDDRLPEWQGWHAFRRGLATNLYRLRVPDKVIQAILRHSDLKTTMNIYVKTVSEDAVNAMSALDSSLLCMDRAPEAPKDDKARVN